MIAKLQGKVDTIEAEWLILMVGGVGYRLFVPASTSSKLSVDQDATLFVYTHVREDAILLYGFHDRQQKQVFEILLTVSSVGPKLALAVLSQLSTGQLVEAVMQADVRMLTRVSGVGRKTAERLILELKDRFKAWQVEPSDEPEPSEAVTPTGILGDVTSALVQLGYNTDHAQSTVQAVLADQPGASIEEALRAALRRLQSV